MRQGRLFKNGDGYATLRMIPGAGSQFAVAHHAQFTRNRLTAHPDAKFDLNPAYQIA
ncbi:hypothetical protein WKW50_24130 [Ochrobactrum sp. GPK 3]